MDELEQKVVSMTIEELRDALKSARNQLLKYADRCDKWAVDSRNGGWSTHQVQDNINTAHSMRVEADQIWKLIDPEGD